MLRGGEASGAGKRRAANPPGRSAASYSAGAAPPRPAPPAARVGGSTRGSSACRVHSPPPPARKSAAGQRCRIKGSRQGGLLEGRADSPVASYRLGNPLPQGSAPRTELHGGDAGLGRKPPPPVAFPEGGPNTKFGRSLSSRAKGPTRSALTATRGLESFALVSEPQMMEALYLRAQAPAKLRSCPFSRKAISLSPPPL